MDSKRPMNHLLLQMIVAMAGRYRELVPDFSNQRIWSGLKSHIAERCDTLKIADFYPMLYESPSHPLALMHKLSWAKVFRRLMIRKAREAGLGDIAKQSVHLASREQLRSFFELVLVETQEVVDGLDALDDLEAVKAAASAYWQDVHPFLPLWKQRQVERDAQYSASLYLYMFHNAVAVMAYGESLSSLVHRALMGGDDADTAMCKAARVADSLRRHPKFMARYLAAAQYSEADFLRRYNQTNTPLTNKIRYPGLYFLLSLLDSFGMLDRLSNEQLGYLCDRAKLDRWENRIEDVGYLGKRRTEYLRHKSIQMSMH